jgi:hypothetical protein
VRERSGTRRDEVTFLALDLLRRAHRVARVRLRLFLVAAAAAYVAAPVSAESRYGGIGAIAPSFYAQNAHASGRPALGVAYYRIDDKRAGRVAAYHIVLNGKSKLTDGQLRRLVTGRELPADATQVQCRRHALDPGVYCAIYRSQWLGRVLYGPFVVLYTSPATQTASAMVSTAAACRG